VAGPYVERLAASRKSRDYRKTDRRPQIDSGQAFAANVIRKNALTYERNTYKKESYRNKFRRDCKRRQPAVCILRRNCFLLLINRLSVEGGSE
jgi:hypothetical protein